MINHPVNLTIPSDLLRDALNDMALFSDKLIFTVDQDYLKITANGTYGDGEIKYIHGEQVTESYQTMFSIEKLKDIMKASKFSKQCTLSIGDNLPLKLNFELITGTGELKYLLAPRIEYD